MSGSTVQVSMKHRDTKTQRHKEIRQTKILDAGFLLCLCAFVSLCFIPYRSCCATFYLRAVPSMRDWTRRLEATTLLIVFPLLWMACSRQAADLKQIQQQRSGGYIVTLLNESGALKQRSDHLTLEVRNASTNELANITNLQIQASMSMPGMGPMFGTFSAPRQSVPGRYDFDADFGMAGRWTFVVTFDPNGRVQFNLSAQ